ncbi:glycosyltransferase family 4 protein [Salinisphaera sp. Q1T1-3]|uniref:glycosyltransferase family 4 protein n=1 Tax=Salinisphaera sp. Q1T1-3 TaxID=2321229 RepID=UPI000E770C6E|nr:glycosyltransferase family 4 protein [Salinisphaera sp. Q1T1-3]RJS94695.1 glycosyltransferase family 1 protein [Salinisphaera sp. Q1T1-3]
MADLTHVNLARGFRGGERQTALLIRALAERGMRQRVIGRRGEPLLARLADVPNLERIAIRKPFILSIHHLRAGLTHAHDGKGAHFAHAAYHVFGTRYVVTRRVDNVPSNSPSTRALFARAARVVVLSDAIGRVLAARYPGLVTQRIPSAAADLAIDTQKASALRARFGGRCVVGQVGALDDSQKGQFDTLAAARTLLAEADDWRFVFVGSGRDEQALADKARAMPQVSFAGQVDNVGDYLAALDIFVFPSRHEGLGSTLLDAMVAGRPIVATAVDGIPELIEDGVNGLLVPPDDPAALAAALRRLRNDPALAARLASAGRERVARYTVAAMAERYRALYAELGVAATAETDA